MSVSSNVSREVQATDERTSASHQSSTHLNAHGKVVDLSEHMADAFAQLEHVQLREVLLESVAAERESIAHIRDSFLQFTAAKHELRKRRTFFASWQRTNNSAMSVEGLSSRMTAEAEASVGRVDSERVLSIFRAAGRLNRVTDEDLGVGGQVHHFELYYRMASRYCDNDDQWQSREYCLPVAAEFKAWLDAARLREPVMTGMYSMLVHEGYTHAELEMIAPLFDRMAAESFAIPEREARKSLAWITVHNGGTEKRHFAHSCTSLEQYCAGAGAPIDLTAAGTMFRSYLRRKGEVMKQLADLL
jgi:hypothetical protein